MNPRQDCEKAQGASLHLTRHLAVIEQCGGIVKLYPDLDPWFEAPYSRELFDLRKRHQYPLGVLRAEALMAEAERFARQVGQEDFLNQNRLRRALRRRKNDSWKAIRQAVLNVIAKQAVRQRPAVLPLVERFQKIGLKLQFPDAERPVRVYLGFPKAVSLAFHILERLLANRAPNQLLGNTDWIWQAIEDCSSFSQVLDTVVDRWMEERAQRFLPNQWWPDQYMGFM